MLARWTTLIAMVGLLVAPAPALAQQASSPDERLTIEVGEGEAACPGGQAFCLRLTGGSLDEIGPGDEVEVTFRNTGSTSHELLVQALTAESEDHTASEKDGIHASTERSMSPGASETFTFTVPEDWRGLYLFCGVAGHEESGMWRSVGFDEATPSVGPLVSLAVLVGLGLALRALTRHG